MTDELDSIIMGEKLSDLHINHAQDLLKLQFPELNGLESVNKDEFKSSIETHNKLQILHCQQRDH